MKIVISCAGSKVTCAKPTCANPDGYMQTKDGKPVMFVAQPLFAPKCDNVIFKTPDDLSDDEPVSWRTRLQKYNQAYSKTPEDNPWKLCKAYMLYENEIYRALEKRFGVDMYILSAGWGMIRADFLTPGYDITFSPKARGDDFYKRRKKADPYQDFCMLPDDGDGPIAFFGGKDYIPLFCSLTEKYRSPRIVFHSSAISQDDAPGCKLEKFGKRSYTNWHYECANNFVNGDLRIDTN